MKNSKLVKIVLIIIMSVAVMLVTKGTFAATSLDPNSLTGITTTENSVTSNDNTLTGNSISTSTSTNSIGLGTSGSLTSQNSTVLTTNNTSNYNNTSLPKTGVEDSMPTVVLFVVIGISAVYAYKKVQDYKNI